MVVPWSAKSANHHELIVMKLGKYGGLLEVRVVYCGTRIFDRSQDEQELERRDLLKLRRSSRSLEVRNAFSI